MNLERLIDRVAREKHVITRFDGGVQPYLTRWTLFGRRSRGGRAVYLHRFLRSDADEMHDHPWPFVSVILSGGYWEKTPAPGWRNGDGPARLRWYGPGRVLVRPANWIHSVLIPEGRECWTLIFRGKKVRPWGFWCPRAGWVPWRLYLAFAEATGAGCPGPEPLALNPPSEGITDGTAHGDGRGVGPPSAGGGGGGGL